MVIILPDRHEKACYAGQTQQAESSKAVGKAANAHATTDTTAACHESAILKGLLGGQPSSRVVELTKGLEPLDWKLTPNRLVFNAVIRVAESVIDAGEPGAGVDPSRVMQELQRTGDYSDPNVQQALTNATAGGYMPVKESSLIELVKGLKAQRARRAMAICGQLLINASTHGEAEAWTAIADVEHLVRLARRAGFDVAAGTKQQRQQLHRRTVAAARCAPLASGRRDPDGSRDDAPARRATRKGWQ